MKRIKLFWYVCILCLIAGCNKHALIQNDTDTTDTTDPASTETKSQPTDSSVDTNTESGDTDTTVPDTDTSGLTALGFEWVALEGGSFEMGSDLMSPPDNYPPEIFTPEGPKHLVNVPDFLINKTEVTVAQYQECIRAHACQESQAINTEDPTDGRCSGPYKNYNNWVSEGRENHPANCLVYRKMTDFCKWVGGRLPSEAEWEYAARSKGQERTYPWGEMEPSCEVAIIDDNELGRGCGLETTAPVCSKPAGNTDDGLCDMGGNVTEYTQDNYHRDYTGAPIDGSAWLVDVTHYKDYKMTRGNNFFSISYHSSVFTRTTARSPVGVLYGDSLVGFRCVR